MDRVAAFSNGVEDGKSRSFAGMVSPEGCKGVHVATYKFTVTVIVRVL